MPPFPPPATFTGTPARYVLPANTVLWRLHRADQPAEEFDQPRDRAFGGGRFDGTTGDPYGYLYASPESDTAVAEHFLPEFADQPGQDRILLRARVADRRRSALRATRGLTLLRLTSAPDLAAVHQDGWLTTAGANQYPQTRAWAAALRAIAPWAQGFVWTSSFDLPRVTMVLFDDRCTDTALLVDEALGESTTTRSGVAGWLGESLKRYGVRTEPARAKHAKVFINYRSSNEYAARLVHNELSRRLGEPAVFRDTASIPLGIPFDEVLIDAVRNAVVMLSLIGRDWEYARDREGNLLLEQEQDWVRKEILEAFASAVTVAPVLVGNRDRLDRRALPEVLAKLPRLQFLSLPHDLNAAKVKPMVTDLLRRRPDLKDDD